MAFKWRISSKDKDDIVLMDAYLAQKGSIIRLWVLLVLVVRLQDRCIKDSRTNSNLIYSIQLI